MKDSQFSHMTFISFRTIWRLRAAEGEEVIGAWFLLSRVISETRLERAEGGGARAERLLEHFIGQFKKSFVCHALQLGLSRLMSYTSHALTQYPPLTPFPAHFVVTACSCADNGICSSCAPDKGARDRRHGSRWQRDSGGYC